MATPEEQKVREALRRYQTRLQFNDEPLLRALLAAVREDERQKTVKLLTEDVARLKEIAAQILEL